MHLTRLAWVEHLRTGKVEQRDLFSILCRQLEVPNDEVLFYSVAVDGLRDDVHACGAMPYSRKMASSSSRW